MISTSASWQPDDILRHAASPVVALFHQFGLHRLNQFPDAKQLNRLATAFHDGCWPGPVFVDQGALPATESRYYEAIIGEDARIPTREHSFHDLFNALIWLQFPRSKRLLNQLHMADIAEVGTHPRTPRRNRVTHFDECGVVIAVPQHARERANKLLSQLDCHQWQHVLYEKRAAWQECLYPVVFGHANLEMMLSPFIGLTGKWLAVTVPDSYGVSSLTEQCKMIDEALQTRIGQLGYFTRSPLLKPLPLLGVPGWSKDQDAAFYANTDYFRPQRPSAKPTIQLPL